MSTADPLDINYLIHERVQDLINTIRSCLEDISLGFDRWDEAYITGPGLYFAIVSGHTVRNHADPMGDNHWPVNNCRDVLADVDRFYEVTKKVARSHDGAVVISVDGIVQKQMVRFYDHSSMSQTEHVPIQYADWMGSRHMSAADTSARPEVVTTMTLSAETGRVTLFENGDYDTRSREQLHHDWQ